MLLTWRLINKCISLLGSTGNPENALRQTLYLWAMQPEEIKTSYFDLLNHLGANIPVANRRHHKAGLVVAGSQGEDLSITNDTFTNDIILLNNFYSQREIHLRYPYHILIQRIFNTAIHPLDFNYN